MSFSVFEPLMSWGLQGPLCGVLLQSSLTLCEPMDRSLPGSSVHGISQARILE